MITLLDGQLVEKGPTHAVIDVGGVGYEVLIPTSTFAALPETDHRTRLFTHLHTREDAMILFGFSSRDERTVFRVLIGVSGVGPRLALAALSAMRPDELRSTVVAGDVQLLTRIPGVGRKTAERMIVELRDRLEPVQLDRGVSTDVSSRGDAVSALEALGLSRTAAERGVQRVLEHHPDEQSTEQIVRLALREA